jgi:hypothetical protein
MVQIHNDTLVLSLSKDERSRSPVRDQCTAAA